MSICGGIETEQQQRIAQEAECDMLQGFYFFKPLSEEDFDKLLTGHEYGQPETFDDGKEDESKKQVIDSQQTGLRNKQKKRILSYFKSRGTS